MSNTCHCHESVVGVISSVISTIISTIVTSFVSIPLVTIVILAIIARVAIVTGVRCWQSLRNYQDCKGDQTQNKYCFHHDCCWLVVQWTRLVLGVSSELNVMLMEKDPLLYIWLESSLLIPCNDPALITHEMWQRWCQFKWLSWYRHKGMNYSELFSILW